VKSPGYLTAPVRVIFGVDAKLALAEEIRRLGCARAVIVVTPQFSSTAYEFAHHIGDLCVGIFSEVEMHTPLAVTEQALDYVNEIGADCLIGLGGSAAIGLTKAIALRTNLPQIALPMAFGGAEATTLLNETTNGLKTHVRSLAVLPEVILYDVNLTLPVPEPIIAATGMMAIAHAVEALYAPDRTPAIMLLAEEGIRIFAQTLPVLHANPEEVLVRSRALHGAWLCGSCLNATSMGLHHKLCEVLGGSFHLSHFDTHAALLPYTVGYNAAVVPDAMLRVARALGAGSAVQGLFDLVRRLDLTPSLAELGFKREHIERAAELVIANPIPNPRPLRRSAIRALLDCALVGAPPPWSFEG
jgi:maleylacetate reductase